MRSLISIIVPIYNAEFYLRRCLESLVSQTYSDLEIVLINDGSTDRSEEIALDYKKKDSRINLISTPNLGAAQARNLGIEKASGDYIGFVDADDFVALDMFEYLLNLIYKYDADLAIIEKIRFKNKSDINNLSNQDIRIHEYSQLEYIKKYMKIGSQTIEYYPCNKLYKKKLLTSEQYPAGSTTEDVVGTYKAVLKADKIIYSNAVKYYYFFNESSVSSNFVLGKALNMINAWDEIIKLSEFNLTYKRWACINRMRIDFNLLFQIARSEEYKKIMSQDYMRVNELLSDLKKNKFKLIKANISLIRKTIILFFCLNYSLSSRIINFLFSIFYKFRKKL